MQRIAYTIIIYFIHTFIYASNYFDENYFSHQNIIPSDEQEHIAKLEDLKSEQQKIEENIKLKYQAKKYTLKDPLVIINPYTTMPLSALIKFKTSINTPINIKLERNNAPDPETDISVDFPAATDHHLQILGLYPNTTNKIIITNKNNNKHTIYIDTENIISKNAEYSKFYNSINSNYLFFVSVSNHDKLSDLYSLDKKANVRWWLKYIVNLKSFWTQVIKPMANGNWVVSYPGNHIIILSPLGQILNIFQEKDKKYRFHHDVMELPNKNFSALSKNESIVEIDLHKQKIIRHIDIKPFFDNENRFCKLYNMDYLCKDPFHINSIEYDKNDDSFIVSSFHQAAVIKFSRSSGELKWILIPNKYDFKGTYENYVLNHDSINSNYRNWFNHSAVLLSNGNLFLYVNRSWFSQNNKNHIGLSSGEEYSIDEKSLSVSHVQSYGLDEKIQGNCCSNVQELPNNLRLVSLRSPYNNKQYPIHSLSVIYDTTGKKLHEIRLLDDYLYRIAVFDIYHFINKQSSTE